MIALWRREDELLRARLTEHVRSVNRAEAGFWIASAVAAGLVLASYAAYRRDVDRRARDARALRAALDRAEEGHRARDTLLAVVGHELRTPLTPALLTTVELSERADLEPGVRSALEAVVRHLRVEARLIDDLLDTMRLHQGEMPFRFRPVDAHELIGRAVVVCGPELRGGHVRLDRHLEASNAWVRADPARLEQAVLHLLRNAVKFTPAGGTVTIATRNEGPSLRIEVRDTGVGIEPDVLPRIFEAFDRGEGAAARRYGGLGLGLAIARPSPRPTAAACWPRATARAAAPASCSSWRAWPTTPPPPPRPRRRPHRPDRPSRLLFVEDDPGTRHACSRLLRQRGYDVRVASSLAEAQRLAAEPPEFDALVSDVGLPDGTGWDLIAPAPRRRPAPRDRPERLRDPRGRAASLQSGFAAHLVKPVDIDVLDAAIRRLLDRPNGRPDPPPTPSRRPAHTRGCRSRRGRLRPAILYRLAPRLDSGERITRKRAAVGAPLGLLHQQAEGPLLCRRPAHPQPRSQRLAPPHDRPVDRASRDRLTRPRAGRYTSTGRRPRPSPAGAEPPEPTDRRSHRCPSTPCAQRCSTSRR